VPRLALVSSLAGFLSNLHIALNIKHTFPQIKMLDDDLRVALDVVVSENAVFGVSRWGMVAPDQ